MEIKDLTIKTTKNHKPYIEVNAIGKKGNTFKVVLFEYEIKGAIMKAIERDLKKNKK